jgi:hypothetical protein
MKIITETVTGHELKQMAANMFGDMVKAVVDVDRRILAIDGELHADLEALLLEKGSSLKNLWGVNLYPEMPGDEFVEFNSMINVRPSQGNRTLGIKSEETRRKVVQVIAERIKR